MKVQITQTVVTKAEVNYDTINKEQAIDWAEEDYDGNSLEFEGEFDGSGVSVTYEVIENDNQKTKS